VGILILVIIIAVVSLAIIGLGIGTFFSGVIKGAQQVGGNPVIKNATGEIKQLITNTTEHAKEKLIA
jgi:flagellar basal body-associated protein FliL